MVSFSLIPPVTFISLMVIRHSEYLHYSNFVFPPTVVQPVVNSGLSAQDLSTIPVLVLERHDTSCGTEEGYSQWVEQEFFNSLIDNGIVWSDIPHYDHLAFVPGLTYYMGTQIHLLNNF